MHLVENKKNMFYTTKVEFYIVIAKRGKKYIKEDIYSRYIKEEP